MSDFLERIKNLSPKRLALLAMELQSRLEALEQAQKEPIAIIGMSCRFPGADNPAAFWKILCEGRDMIGEVPAERWDLQDYYDPDPDAPGKMNTRFGGFIEGVDRFDPHFFGISPREANSMDPQQRLLLEVGWEALENAALAPEKLEGSATGIFLGICSTDYPQLLLGQGRDAFDAYLATGSSHAIASGRLSYVLGVHGPSLSIDTACSSSLVAVHQACLSLHAKECRLALAGGVNAMLAPDTTITLSKARMMAPDGRCKTFDAAADGFVRGEGCGIVVLKRLSDALAEGDNILALILGSAVNQDGRSSGITAPNGPAQEAVMRAALAAAGLDPSEIDYVETHGTGTSLGDPIEVNALGAVLGKGRAQNQRLKIGSVKTNIGHLEGAAGVAGLIKLVLALQHRQIPPHLHLKKRNPYIPWDDLAIDIPTELTPWEANNRRRIGATSSFGFSGTNAHVIVAEFDQSRHRPSVHGRHSSEGNESMPEPATHLLALSARNEAALRELALRYANYLQEHPRVPLADLCFTANAGRSHFAHRFAVVADSSAALQERLRAFAAGSLPAGAHYHEVAGNKAPELAFLFSGQGSQYAGMGRRLYETQPVFRAALDKCAEILRADLDRPLLEVLFENPPVISDQSSVIGHQPSGNADHRSLDTGRLLDQTAYTQPALFALEYALAELWRSWGVVPAAVMGHSVGEYAAACVAGMMSLDEGLKLIAARGRLMQALPQNGAMVAVFAEEDKVAALLRGYENEVSIAALNGPANTVISGLAASVRQIVNQCEAAGLKCKALNVSHAFHSPLMAPMLDDFERVAGEIQFHDPQIPLIANLTARPLAFNDPRSAAHDSRSSLEDPRLYWRRHAREAVRFCASIEVLHQQGFRVFVEIGPGSTLLGMAGKCLPEESHCAWLPSLKKDRDDRQQMLQTLAALYCRGVEVDFARLDHHLARRKIVLPNYPFQRERYWIEGGARGREQKENSKEHALDEWLYEVEWRRLPRPGEGPNISSPDYFPALDDVARSVRPKIAQVFAENGLQTYEGLLPLLDAVCSAYVLQAFEKLGWQWRLGQRVSIDDLCTRLRIQARHRRLLERMLLMLQEDGILLKKEIAWEVCRLPAGPQAVPAMRALQEQFPACRAELKIAQRCGENLAEALRGEIDPLQLLFGGGAIADAEELYQEAPNSKAFNLLLQQAVAAALQNLPHDRKVRVLEIGAGTGGTTTRVLPVFPAERTEYVFTDAGQFFLARAAEKFKAFPFVRYHTLDISGDVAAQGFAAQQFDLIIAANVLHATSDLRVTLANVRKLLAPGGLLALLEGVQPQRFGDLTVGLTEGWWNYADRDLRPDYALLSESKWLALLQNTGFAEAIALPEGEDRIGVLKTQAVILARAPQAENAKAPVRQAESEQGGGVWIVFADQEGVGEKLAQRLGEAGDACVMVDAAAEYAARGNGRFAINPAQPEDGKRLLREAVPQAAQPCRGVIHLWAMDAPDSEHLAVPALQEAQIKTTASVLHLVQAMAASPAMKAARLWLATKNAQAVGAEGALSVSSAALWGLAKVIALEHPDLRCTCVDLEGRSPAEDAQNLFDEICAAGEEDQVAVRHGARYVPRLVRSSVRIEEGGSKIENRSDPGDPRSAIHDHLSPLFDPRSSYLITGGLAGIGLLVAEWMVARGARHLVLIGRSAPSAQAQETLQSLQAAGARIIVEQADVADAGRMGSIFARLAENLPPLRGVIHSAGVIDDGILLQQEWPRFEKVMKAKVQGAWCLHELTKDLPLDFFILFSTGAALIGSAGQGNHAAANAFMDALAHHRRRLGLPALSINWGAWSDVGILTRHGQSARITAGGRRVIAPAQGLRILARLLRRAPAQVGVLPVNWDELFESANAYRRAPFLCEVMPAAPAKKKSEKSKTPAPSFLEQLHAAPPSKRWSSLHALVREHAAKILGFDPARPVPLQQPLTELGLDSLMAVELRNALGKSLAQTLPATLLFDHPTIEALVNHLGKNVLALDLPGHGEEQAHIENGKAAMAVKEARLDELTEDEMAAMLEERLGAI